MAAYGGSKIHSERGGITVEEVTNKGKNGDKKSPLFVPLYELSQSEKDRFMNNRTLRPPKNINLVEGDSIDSMEFLNTIEIDNFPNEHFLSSQIKEVNGMDYSNYFIEQHYRQFNSESVSSEISQGSTKSSSITNDSILYSLPEFQEETCSSNVSSSTEVEGCNTESDLPADCSDANHPEYNNDNIDYDANAMNDFIRNSRYSKNAAIIGLLRNNLISLNDLELNDENKKNSHSENDSHDVLYSLDEEHETMVRNLVDDPTEEFDSPLDEITAFPFLVPHPEDPEFFTHPLQAYGKVNDAGIDFSLPHIGKKTVMTPRQYFIREGLKEEKFQFPRKTTDAPKPKLNFNFSKTSHAWSPHKQNRSNTSSDSSYKSTINDENDGFILNRNEFSN